MLGSKDTWYSLDEGIEEKYSVMIWYQSNKYFNYRTSLSNSCTYVLTQISRKQSKTLLLPNHTNITSILRWLKIGEKIVFKVSNVCLCFWIVFFFLWYNGNVKNMENQLVTIDRIFLWDKKYIYLYFLYKYIAYITKNRFMKTIIADIMLTTNNRYEPRENIKLSSWYFK